MTNVKLMNKLLKSLIDLIFPPKCEVCRKSSEVALCQDCFVEIKFMKPHLGIYSVSAYEGVLKEAIHRFKFKNRKALAEPLAILMVKYLGHLPSFDHQEIDTIVPVPLHNKRLRERGFNQAELMGQVIAKYLEKPLYNALARIKKTKAQFDLPRDDRFHNIKDAFKVVDSKAIYNKRVLLLDDIYTTGATIAECSKCLRIAGAKRVEVLTLSRAVE